MKLLNRISPVSIFLCICVIYVAGFFAHAIYLHKTVYGDGVYYYAWLSLQPSKYSVGPALFWAPAYLLTHNQITVAATSVLATIFSLILLWNLLLKYFSKTVSIMTVAAIAGASNLLFYGSLDVVNSHALTFFAATIFLSLLNSAKKQWFAIGAVLGIAGLMRTQDLLYAILLLPSLTKKNIVLIIAGFLLVFSPQFLAWQRISGKFWINPYLLHEGFNFTKPHILGALFGVQNGLFLWTPVTILGTIGLITKKRFLMLAVFLLELYTVASWSTWWQGASYSGRMFVSTLPILSFGIALIFTRLTHYKWTQAYFLITIVIPLSVTNAVNIIYFLLRV
ncbi:MAG: glycosyltransferase family 39 protein [Candidatus Gottesmanbacteria bacterium]|nr:glycosyltransferase family 39 protein [Candidatus Gottesmanbacteria bacterium]